MSRSKNGSDGRARNVPPEHGKIKPEEVRNPWGCAGKPISKPPTLIDELLWQEASRIVSYDSDGPVDAKKRLIQEEFFSALKDEDKVVRARLLAMLQETGARVEQQRSQIYYFVVEKKATLVHQFDSAQMLGRTPPDILPHPDHVTIVEGQVLFSGPEDRRARARWEIIKSAIRVAACLHEIIRNEFRRTGCSEVRDQLRMIEKHRRWLMRAVPKGWNWREEIYCRESKLDFTKQLVRDLKEIGYVAPDALD